MTQLREPDAIIATWLEHGPQRLPVETRRAIAVGLRTQPRARRMAILGGSFMLPISRIATAAGVAVAAGAISILVLSNRGVGPGALASPNAVPTASVALPASPSAPPPATPSPVATVLPPLETADWIPYTSSRYGYSISYPPTGWTATPGDHDWILENDIAFTSRAPDWFETPGAADGLGILVSVWSVTVDPGTTLEDWMATYCAAERSAPCANATDLRSALLPGGPSRIRGWLNVSREPMAAFLAPAGPGSDAGIVYVAAIWRADHDPSVQPWGGSQRLLEAFLSTMTVPKAAADGSPSAS